jgi:hypothetical protein
MFKKSVNVIHKDFPNIDFSLLNLWHIEFFALAQAVSCMILRFYVDRYLKLYFIISCGKHKADVIFFTTGLKMPETEDVRWHLRSYSEH